MKNIEDKLLFRKIQKGNKKAFDALFRKYYTQLVRFAIAYVHDGTIAEEMVQDVFIRIWENAPCTDIETSVQAYLHTSVRNQALNYLKHTEVKKRHEQEQVKQAEVLDEFPGSVNMGFFQEVLAKAIGNLPDKCREIFEMAKFQGLSYDEIAEYLQVSGKTVENQMGIALKKLRENMLPYSDRIFDKY